MSNDICKKEVEEMTDKEMEAELKENCKNIRKVSVLEKLQLHEWTIDELEEMYIIYKLLEATNSLKATNVEEFIQNGEYRRRHGIFDEYKTSELTKEMRSKLCDFLNIKRKEE